MSNIIVALSDRLNTPPSSPMHPSAPTSPPPGRLLILSSSALQANRLTAMLLPFFKAVFPPSRHPRKVLPKPPKLTILSTQRHREDSNHSSTSSRHSVPRHSIPKEFSRNVDLPTARRGTHPPLYQRRDVGGSWKSPPTLSVSQTPGGGNPSSVTSWFGSWIRRGGPLAASDKSIPSLGESCSPFSPRISESPTDPLEPERDIPPPEVDVIKDQNGEVVDVKLATSFQHCRRRSSATLPDDIDLKRRGSITLNNVTFTEDPFRVTGFHSCRYHVDYHLQSMESTPEVEKDVFRVLKEDILFFFTPPVHAMPLNPRLSPALPRTFSGQRKVTCLIADLDAVEIHRLTVLIEDDEEQQTREIIPPKDDRQWRRLQEWAIDGHAGMEAIVKEVLV